jgi:hypothetical protein
MIGGRCGVCSAGEDAVSPTTDARTKGVSQDGAMRANSIVCLEESLDLFVAIRDV